MPVGQLEEEDYEYGYDEDEELSQQPTHQQYVRRRVIRRKVVRHNSLRRKIILFLAVAAFFAVAITGCSSIIASRGFEIVQMRTEAAKLEAENAKLRIANAQLKNPARIKEIAEQNLGMCVSERVYFAEGK